MSASVTRILAAASGKSGPGPILWSLRTDDGDAFSGDPDQPFFIASATKLYVTAILAQLRTEGALSWDAPIADALPDLPIGDLVGDASVREVMAHTSGLGDYFEGSRSDGPTTFERVLARDAGWDVHDVIEWTRGTPRGTRGKGHYSDTGYQLLGALIERIDGRSFAASVQARIAAPLGLTGTYVFSLTTLDEYDRIAPMFDGDTRLRIPLAMASVQADGGVVSTLRDGQAFLDGFFGGRLFPAELMGEIASDWHAIFRPLEYGTGIMRFRLPRIVTGFRRVPPFLGHSGASGTVMFRSPELGVTVVGTVNQIRRRSLPFQLMVRTALAKRA